MKWNITASREDIALLLEAGFIYRDMKRFEEARQVFAGVRALLPASDVPEVALGTVSFCEGNFAEAAAQYRKVLDRNPNNAWAHAHLAEAYIFDLKKEQARPHIERALKLDGRGPCGDLARSLLQFADTVRYA